MQNTYQDLITEIQNKNPGISPKLEGGKKFQMKTDFKPAGDQPEAIKQLVNGANKDQLSQVLLGVTGSGKTFTMAKVIEKTNRPALILAPNKTLAAQLYGEMKSFFPDNAVEYFVSYYDYYTPEAYVPRSDTYIEKEASINEQIDRMRHSATRSLLERDDVVIVSSVSCIYGLGSVEAYSKMTLSLKTNYDYNREELIKSLVALQYKRNDQNFYRGTFRARGEYLEIFPSHLEDRAWRLSLFGDKLEKIEEFDPLTGDLVNELDVIKVYANSHYITPKPTIEQAIIKIKRELEVTLKKFKEQNKLLEAQRLEERTKFDLEMIEATGSCAGIENYSRFLSGRKPGEPPPTLFEYFPDNTLIFVDECHVTVPQLNGMYKGDRSRKSNLAEYGFRLPSCMDNRPLKFEEWDAMRTQTVFVSATPGPWELKQTKNKFVEQVIRPTGLIDPPVEIRPAKNQVDDLMHECLKVIDNNYRVLVTTLTKKMAEDLTEYLHENGIKVRYMHSDIDTLERIEIMRDLRLGVFDVLVGINLLREGLDIPECALVGILDADKEGFLRSETSLIQTIGRAARNLDGKVILYADKETKSIKNAIKETDRRRTIQIAYNKKHKIDAKTIKKEIGDVLESVYEKDYVKVGTDENIGGNLKKHLKSLNKRMKEAATNLEFEEAAKIRDEIRKLEASELEITLNPKVKKYSSNNKIYPKGRSTMGLPGTRAQKGKKEMEANKIIITGGATRMGAAIARKLSGPNIEIVIHYNKSKSKAESLKKELEKNGSKIYLAKGDLSKETDVNKILKFAKTKLKYFDCLINNASLFENDKLENFTTDSWGHHLRTNLRTPALLSKEFAKNIKGKNNNIINIIDQRVFKLTPYFFSYTISKTGLYTLTKTSAMSLAPNIRVNAIAPGPTIKNKRQSDKHFKKQYLATPLRKQVDVNEICNAVDFFIKNSSITGQVLAIDSGQNLNWQTPDVIGKE